MKHWDYYASRQGITKCIVNSYYILLVLLLIATKVTAFESANILTTDYLTFTSDKPGKSNLEIYITIDNSAIQFISDEFGFSASINTNVIILDADQCLVAEQIFNKEFATYKYEETIDNSINQTIELFFNLKPGFYTAKIIISDKNAKREFKDYLNIYLPDYSGKNLTLSSIQLSKMSSINIQNTSHIFTYKNPYISIYYELYNIACPSLNTIYSIINEKGEIIYTSQDQVSAKDSRQGFKSSFSIRSLPSGNYKLKITKIETQTSRQAFSYTDFTVIQSPNNLKFKKFEDALAELKYIASANEINRLKEIPVNEQQKELNKFWKKKDPTPETEENELMNEYYSRLMIANSNFSHDEMPGWKTDFGMIYMIFGTPDAIIKSSEFEFSYSAQIWNYKKLGLNFVFEARNYLSFYSLQNKSYICANYLPE